MLEMQGFIVLQCKNKYCGRWGAKEIRTVISGKRYKCNFCGSTFSIKKKSEYGIALNYHGPYSTGKEASIKVQDLNRGVK